jgi:voltage-gated potassium channel
MNIKRRLSMVCAAIFMVVMVGSSGYYIIYGGKFRFVDCMFMTVISLTSVGYGEVLPVSGNLPAEIYTMVLISLGMGVILYGISTLTALIIEGELSGILRKNKMQKRISKLTGHYIVCGGGETGQPLVVELIRNREQVVLVEFDSEKIQQCSDIEGLLYVEGDATEEEHLISAGIQNAKGIVSCLSSDKDNLYITMTARMLNPALRIVTRNINPRHTAKLRKAGADSVVSPNSIGALRMASEMIRPAAVDFLDSMLRSQKGHLRIHQLSVSTAAAVIGATIDETGLKSRYNLLILGLKTPGLEMAFNPPPDTKLKDGMTLVVMGDVDDIAQARSVF